MKTNIFLLTILLVSVAHARTLTDIEKDLKKAESQLLDSLDTIDHGRYAIPSSKEDNAHSKSLYKKPISEIKALKGNLCSWHGRSNIQSDDINCAIINFRITYDLLSRELEQRSAVANEKEVEEYRHMDDKQEMSLERKIATGVFWVAVVGLIRHWAVNNR